MTKRELVENFFIMAGAMDGEEPMTNLRLNKMMFLAQAWCLTKTGNLLFDEPFLAWTYGPVIRATYDTYKANGAAPILLVNEEFNITDIEEDVQDILFAVYGRYGTAGTDALVDLTHSVPAWRAARDEADQVISYKAVQEHFDSLEEMKTTKDFVGKIPILETVNEEGALILPADWSE